MRQDRSNAYQRALTPSTIFTDRTLTTLLQAALVSVWLGIPFAALWFLFIQFVELVINPRLVRLFVEPHLKTSGERARFNGAIIILIGSTAHATGWTTAWLIGGAGASLLGAVWLAAGFIHSLTYFTNSRLQFVACIAPSFVACAVIPLVQESIPPAMLVFALIIVSLAAMQGYRARKLLNAALVKSKAERAAAVDSKRAKNQFLATMSHELRTPLNAIIGYAEIIEEDQGSVHVASAQDAAHIKRAAHHLLDMITEILDFATIEAGEMTVSLGETDIANVVGAIVDIAEPAAASNANRIVVSIDPSLGIVVTDAGKVRKALLNLVSNACNFTAGGVITVGVRMNDAGLLQMAVKDTGCGIDPARAARLFEPFVQGDGSLTRARDGAGLGLVITRSLARILGGDVVLESRPGLGSTFAMTIAVHPSPRAHEDTKTECPAPLPAAPPRASLLRRA